MAGELLRTMRRALFMLPLVACVTASASADDVDEAPVPQVNMIQISPEQVAQWVFGNQQFGQNARKGAETALKLQIDFVAEIGDLAEAQRSKLLLAGQGDIERFFDVFERLQRDIPNGQVPQNEYQKIWQRLQPLQTRFAAGLHGRSSLFRRTLRSTLDADQLAKFDTLDAERRKRQYLAVVKVTVATIEGKVPLTVDQRTKLIDLIMTKSQPPEAWGQSYYQYYVVLYALSKIPEQDVKPIFLDSEWPVIEGIIRQGRAWEHQIKQLEKADLDADTVGLFR